MSEPGSKPYAISKQVVVAAFEKVRSKKGAAGVDGVTVEQFARDEKNNLYKLWNRMSSGRYFPAPVRLVEIPKSGGRGTRALGVPTGVAKCGLVQAVVGLGVGDAPVSSVGGPAGGDLVFEAVRRRPGFGM